MSVAQIRREILQAAQEKAGGVLPWREFMRLALYDPQIGYYAREVRDVGRAGDFTTVPARSTWLGQTLQNWRAQVGIPAEWPWVELGPGGGQLAEVLAPSRWRPADWRRPPLHLVEVSSSLRKQQQHSLRGRRVQHWETPAAALSATAGCGVLLGNELVDAFPCSVFELRPEGWREVAVRFSGEGVYPAWLESPLPESTLWSVADFPVGQRIEIHESFRDWWASWSPLVRQGWVVWIDYGAKTTEIYRRPQGSLRGYWKQQRVAWPEVLARFGQQDLTADVNFDDLRLWGEALGWNALYEASLAEFLQTFSPPRNLSEEEHRFLAPEDAGGAFQVLILRKVESAPTTPTG